jgi:chloramphenicol O-acetyltransferase type A
VPSGYSLLDLDTWSRREHFRFFRGYDNPFFNLCADVDVSRVAEACRAPGGPSFFVASLYLSLRAVNDVEPFRYRLRGDGVVVYDAIHAGSTILRDDGTFGFGYFDYSSDFGPFRSQAEEVLNVARKGSGALEDRPDRDDMIHYSVIPWIAFTSFAHARRWGTKESVPKIVFGRRHGEPGAERMPLSVEVHHALVDGLHVGEFFRCFQDYLDDPPLD